MVNEIASIVYLIYDTFIMGVMNVCACEIQLEGAAGGAAPVVEMSFCSFPELSSLSVAF